MSAPEIEWDDLWDYVVPAAGEYDKPIRIDVGMPYGPEIGLTVELFGADEAPMTPAKARELAFALINAAADCDTAIIREGDGSEAPGQVNVRPLDFPADAIECADGWLKLDIKFNHGPDECLNRCRRVCAVDPVQKACGDRQVPGEVGIVPSDGAAAAGAELHAADVNVHDDSSTGGKPAATGPANSVEAPPCRGCDSGPGRSEAQR